VRTGDVIAQRYRLERLLGAGGMGAVWAATHLVTGKPVALKLLRPRDDDDNARRRVLREARAACAVQHPSVVPVHDVLEADDGSPVLVMDLLEGESLRARLDRERTLPLAEALRIAEIVLGALAVAHDAGIVHRDLKPDNLFVLGDGQIKLLDFGVAKLVAADGPAAGPGTLTATGAMIGTPFYMSPEQAFGEPVDGRADLWALGVVMYECLAGEPPTHGENLGQVLRRLTTGDLRPLLEQAPGVPPAIAAVVDSLLSIDAGNRPASARAALEALRTAAERPPDPPPAGEPASEALTVHAPPARRFGLGVALIALGLGAAAVLAATRGPASAPPATAASAARIEAPTPAPIAPSGAPSAPATSAASETPRPRPAPSARATASARPGPSARPASSASSAPKAAPRLLTEVPF
jgi:serine/threonine-protein kinase